MMSKKTSSARSLAGQAGMIALAYAAGRVFDAAGLPVPYLSGPMLATAILSALQIAPVMLPPVRDFALILAGVSIGTSVTPDTIAAFANYPLSLLILAAGVVAIMLASAVALRSFGWTARDAFFASAPGALSNVLVIAAEEKADIARIVVVQLSRLFVLVAILPILLAVLEHAEAPVARSVLPVTPGALALLLAGALVSALLFERLAISGAYILGGMVTTALLTGSGVVRGSFPTPLATLAFLLVGIFIGQRFRGLEGMTVLRTMPAAAVSLVASLGTAWVFAGLVTLVVGVPFGETAVAFAPGGLEAMTVLAFGLGLDPLYVGVHHLARFLFVAALVPAALRWLPALQRRAETPQE
jgi:membrane AbrB-like protein